MPAHKQQKEKTRSQTTMAVTSHVFKMTQQQSAEFQRMWAKGLSKKKKYRKICVGGMIIETWK